MPSEGVVAIVPYFENFTVKLILADACSKFSTDISILEGVENRRYYGRSASQIEEETRIEYDTEQGLTALIYDNDEMIVLPIREIEDGEAGAENDYVYYFSFQFSR